MSSCFRARVEHFSPILFEIELREQDDVQRRITENHGPHARKDAPAVAQLTPAARPRKQAAISRNCP